MNTVSTQVTILPAWFGILRIHLDMRGYRSLIHSTPRMPQKMEYSRQMRPLMLNGMPE